VPQLRQWSNTVSQVRRAAALVTGQRLNLVLAMLLLVGGAWLFIELAGDVLEGDTHEFDAAVLRALRSGEDFGDPVGPFWLRNTARDVTALGSASVLLIVTLAVAGFLALTKNYAAMVLVLAATWGGQLICSALKAGLDRARPDIVPHWDTVATASFPSGHAMMSAVVYLTLGVMLANFVQGRRLKTYIIGIAAGLTFLVGASRLFLGVHYPTDVLAGWTAGLVWALFCGLAVSLYKQRRGKTRLSLNTQTD
jgi:undecaprenyl-diphosphatase